MHVQRFLGRQMKAVVEKRGLSPAGPARQGQTPGTRRRSAKFSSSGSIIFKGSGAGRQPDVCSNSNQFSPQMLRALDALARGKPRKQIAFEMGISEHTLKTYLWKVYQRLNVQNAPQAVAEALERGLIGRSGKASR